jgi:hypothetical protein
LHHFLFSDKIGVLYHLKNSVSFTLSNNKITFKDGYVSIYGRIIYIEEGTMISVTPDSIKNGYVVLSVNTADNSVSMYIKEQSGSYPALTRTNLTISDGLYEYALCGYKKTTTSVTLDNNFKREIIYSTSAVVDNSINEFYNDFLMRIHTPVEVSNGIYKISGYDSIALGERLLVIVVNGDTVVTIPGQLLFQEVGSICNVNYVYMGSDYILNLSYSNNVTTFTLGSTTHVITAIFVYR